MPTIEYQDRVMSVVDDTRLSFRARGIAAVHELTGCKLSARELAGHSPEGKAACLTALDELRRYGYITTERVQHPSGQWETVNTYHRVPSTDKPDSVNQDSVDRDRNPVNRNPVTGTRASVEPRPKPTLPNSVNRDSFINTYIDIHTLSDQLENSIGEPETGTRQNTTVLVPSETVKSCSRCVSTKPLSGFGLKLDETPAGICSECVSGLTQAEKMRLRFQGQL